MNKRGQGGSELRVQGKRSHDRAAARICQLSAEKLKCQRRRASSEIQGACSAKLEQWCGHNEVLFATLLNHNGFAIADIGGKGRFTPPDVRENFYTESEPNSIGLLDTGDYEISAAVLKSRPREKQTLSSGKTSMFRNA